MPPTPTPSPSLRERNKVRRREQITEAALRLFAERGFEGVTIDEIADAADVSRRTFFRYFARKEDVILAWKQQMADELRAALAERPEQEQPLDVVHRALATVPACIARDLTRPRRGESNSGPHDAHSTIGEALGALAP